MKRIQTVAASLALALALPAVAADVADLAAQCESCHGPAGVSGHSDIPTIAGQSPEYLLRQLRGFARWDRPCIKSDYRYLLGHPDSPGLQGLQGIQSHKIIGGHNRLHLHLALIQKQAYGMLT